MLTYIACLLMTIYKNRAGEKVHIVSTFVSGQIKEDGERDIDPSKYHHIVHHVNTYLQQDMVSFCLVIHAYNYGLFFNSYV